MVDNLGWVETEHEKSLNLKIQRDLARRISSRMVSMIEKMGGVHVNSAKVLDDVLEGVLRESIFIGESRVFYVQGLGYAGWSEEHREYAQPHPKVDKKYLIKQEKKKDVKNFARGMGEYPAYFNL